MDVSDSFILPIRLDWLVVLWRKVPFRFWQLIVQVQPYFHFFIHLHCILHNEAQEQLYLAEYYKFCSRIVIWLSNSRSLSTTYLVLPMFQSGTLHLTGLCLFSRIKVNKIFLFHCILIKWKSEVKVIVHNTRCGRKSVALVFCHTS
jgi:hypothetical protein